MARLELVCPASLGNKELQRFVPLLSGPNSDGLFERLYKYFAIADLPCFCGGYNGVDHLVDDLV